METEDSSDRTVPDYLLFVSAFVGFTIGTFGIIFSSIFATFIGGAILSLSILSFWFRPDPEERDDW